MVDLRDEHIGGLSVYVPPGPVAADVVDNVAGGCQLIVPLIHSLPDHVLHGLVEWCGDKALRRFGFLNRLLDRL